MYFVFFMAGALLASAPAFAQDQASEGPERPLLRYAGEPIPIPFQCTGDDLQSFEMVCSARVPCPVYLQLAAVEPVGAKLIVAGNLHNTTSTMYSILLISEDGGQTWFEAHERLRDAALDRAHFHDSDTGWVAGHVLGAPPRDPFFLLTTDGGKYWRRRAVFGNGGTGVIEKFWFNDEQSGGLLIDRIRTGEAGGRYERYETMTGGANWMIREVKTEPIRVRNITPASPHPDWRLFADGETGAWQIQQRQSTEWATVAAFTIQVGQCVPEQEAPPAPPAETVAEPAQPVEQPVAPGGVFRIPGPGQQRRPPASTQPPSPNKPPALKEEGP